MTTDLGFKTEHVLTLQVTLPSLKYGAPQIRQFARDASNSLAAVPGVESAAATNMVPGSSEVGVGLSPTAAGRSTGWTRRSGAHAG